MHLFTGVCTIISRLTGPIFNGAWKLLIELAFFISIHNWPFLLFFSQKNHCVGCHPDSIVCLSLLSTAQRQYRKCQSLDNLLNIPELVILCKLIVRALPYCWIITMPGVVSYLWKYRVNELAPLPSDWHRLRLYTNFFWLTHTTNRDLISKHFL